MFNNNFVSRIFNNKIVHALRGFFFAGASISFLSSSLAGLKTSLLIVGELADLGRLLAAAGELFDVRVRRVVDDERFERSILPLEEVYQALAAEKLARKLALALDGGDARRSVHCGHRIFPIFSRVPRKLFWAKNYSECRDELIAIAQS